MQEITSTQARAIKTADDLCFDHKTVNGQPVGFIRAIVRAKDLIGGGSTTGYAIEIPVEVSTVNDYSRHSTGDVTAFAMLMSVQHNDVARTLARHIKAGSRIAFVWTRDNSSPVTEAAGIVVDMLDVKVQNGSVCDTFRVVTYIGLDSTARMVKRG